TSAIGGSPSGSGGPRSVYENLSVVRSPLSVVGEIRGPPASASQSPVATVFATDNGQRTRMAFDTARNATYLCDRCVPGMWVFVKKIPSGLPAATMGGPSPCFPEAGPMSPARARKRPSPHRPPPSLGKPRGVLHPRVQQVGPDHFGIACFDCHKGSSKF